MNNTPYGKWKPKMSSLHLAYNGLIFVIENSRKTNFSSSCRNHLLHILKNKTNNYGVMAWRCNCEKKSINYLMKWEKVLNITPKLKHKKQTNLIVAKFAYAWVKNPMRASFLFYLIKASVSKYAFDTKLKVQSEKIRNVGNTIRNPHTNSHVYYSLTTKRKLAKILKLGLNFLDAYSYPWDEVRSYETRGFLDTKMDV